MKTIKLLVASICFVIAGTSFLHAKDTNKRSSYSYDPYYESNGTSKKSFGNYEIRDYSEKAQTFSLEGFEKIGSSYIWRNVTRNDELYSHTNLSLMYNKITFSLDAFVDFTDYGTAVGYGDQAFEVTEMDIGIRWEDKWNKLMYSVELKHYLFPNKYTPVNAKGRLSNESTSEINVLLGYDTFLSPSLLISADIDESQGLYFELGGSYDWNFQLLGYNTKLVASLGLGIGSAEFNDYNFGVDNFAPTGLSLNFDWDWLILKNLIVTPQLGVSFPVDSDISDALKASTNIQSDPTTVYFSIKASFSF